MKNKVAINSVIYTISGLILKASNFFLLPLYTSYLSTEDYGITNLSSSFGNVMAYIIAFSLYSAVMRFYTDVKGNNSKTKELYSTVISFVALSCLIYTIVMILFHGFIGRYILRGIVFLPTMLLIFLSTSFHCFYIIYQDILKAKQESVRSAITGLVYFFLQIGLNILFVAILKKGANGMLMSVLICNVLGTLWMLIDLGRQRLIQIKINYSLLKEMLKYSIPLLPHNLSTNIAELTSRIFLNGGGSLSSVGLYGVASQFGRVADTIQVSINSAFEPWFYSQMKTGTLEAKKTIITLTNDIIWAFGFVLIGLALFSQEAVHFMTSSAYHTVWIYVPLLVVAYAIKIPYYFYVCILYYNKNSTKYIFIATLTASIINVVLSYFLIGLFDIYGSVLADIIAMIIRVGMIIYISNRTERIGYNIWSFMARIGVVLGLILIGLIPTYIRFSGGVSIFNFFYKLIIICIYLMLILTIISKEHNTKPMHLLKSVLRARRK